MGKNYFREISVICFYTFFMAATGYFYYAAIPSLVSKDALIALDAAMTFSFLSGVFGTIFYRWMRNFF